MRQRAYFSQSCSDKVIRWWKDNELPAKCKDLLLLLYVMVNEEGFGFRIVGRTM